MIKSKFSQQKSLGLYPIVDSITWLEKLLALGVRTIQLRIKDKNHPALENEIEQSIALANQYTAKLFINDYWELAIRYRAYGVHLGQSDLDTANISKIHQSGLKLGISTHSDEEVARAKTCHPFYLACGPIFHTTSKIMPFAPRGIAALKQLREKVDCPIVAIGGINENNIHEVIETGVEGIAMISAITQAQDPIAATNFFLNLIQHDNHTR